MRLSFLIFTEIAKLNTREMFRNHQISRLNTLKMFFSNREIRYQQMLIPLRYIQFLEAAVCRCLGFFKVQRKTHVPEPLS